MKVRYKVERYSKNSTTAYLLYKAGDPFEISAIEPKEFCCDSMKDAWNEHYVGFGKYHRMCNVVYEVCIYKPFFYPEGSFVEELKIQYCPFCAEKIVTEEATELATTI